MINVECLEYLLAFTIVLIVSAAYYAAARLLSPPPRRGGDAVLPYACGEKGEAVEAAEPPYAIAMLVFAAIESVPIAVLAVASHSWISAIPLLVAALAAPYVVVGGVKRESS